MASHFLFVIVVAAIGLLMYWTGHMIDRFDAGLMLVVFLFEPAGRILLGIASVPTGILLALPLALVAAFFLGRHQPTGCHEETEVELAD